MIVCIGDSITAAQHVEHGWVEHLGFVNAGVSGDTTRQALERFPRDVQNRSPEKVVIQFGHNDCNRWETDRGLPRVSPAAFRANLAEMIERSRVFGAIPYLCTLTPSRKSEQHREDTERYDEIIRAVALTTNVELIDVHSAFDRPGLLLDDGLHLSSDGHLVYAECVKAAL